MTKLLLFISTFCLLTINGFSQLNTKIDKSKYRLGKSICQNGCKLNFWVGNAAKTKYEVIVERKLKSKNLFFTMEPAMNGEYSLKDKNNDGFLDFVTNYHGYDIIYLFNTIHNRFEQQPVYIPEVAGLIDNKRNVYWSYREAQYSDHMSFSVLYQFKGNNLLERYKLVYVTKDDDDQVFRIDLYKMPVLTGNKEMLVKTITTKNVTRFQHKNYWRMNYMKLLGLRKVIPAHTE